MMTSDFAPQLLAALLMGITALIITRRLFMPLIRAELATVAGKRRLMAATVFACSWYAGCAAYLIYHQYWSSTLGLVLVGCMATWWTDTLFFLIHHAWSRWLVIALMPLTMAGYGLTPWTDALAGMLYGSSILWVLKFLFWRMKQQDALGQGDPEFICVIALGSGLYGTWATLLLSSLGGILLAYIAYLRVGHFPRRIPLGAYMALVGSLCIIGYRVSSMTCLIWPS